MRLEREALWHTMGKSLDITNAGPGTRIVGTESASAPVTSTTIDELVRRKSLERVDFIKLDIEGAELSALRGAEQALRRFRPKLAVALYHDLKDFALIPEYLNGLNLGYRFFLDHFTIHAEETVLFAIALG